MIIAGLRIEAVNATVWHVRDASWRVLGGVVRHGAAGPQSRPQFRAFGEDFSTLREAVVEFTKIRGVVPFDAKGDAP